MNKTKIDFKIPYKSSKEIREAFIHFFTDRSHKFVRSDSLVPKNDPTILFTNAGMNQFKGIFLGEMAVDSKRVVNSQKCLRVSGKHNDLEEVGKDGSHHTFFEMLGNWSFGDYYKKEAIQWSWELLTKVFKLPKERLFVTIYHDDQESAEIWKQVTDIDHARILSFDSDNFWEMGAVGPCGPCTEIHFDIGDLDSQNDTYKDSRLGVNGTNDRYMEIWNLVFIQYERLENKTLKPLANKHVDTGAGLERLCAVIQNKFSNYSTDVFVPIIEKIVELSGVTYEEGDKGIPHRVISDHVRALVTTIADGTTPGNEGRGYVIRRVLRRASRFAHQLGVKKPMIYKLVPVVSGLLGDHYPEIKEREAYLSEVICAEEERFLKTLEQGLVKLDKLIAQLKKKKKTTISGEDAFLFHDTYGFPLDLTCLIAEESQLVVDHTAYDQCMREQRLRARSATKFSHHFLSEDSWTILNQGRETVFVGYDKLSESVKTQRYKEENDYVYLVCDRTPFYAESGGQVGDRGVLSNQELTLTVEDTVKIVDLWVHKCRLVKGLLNQKNVASLTATVDGEFRENTLCNHSATHLLHAALRQVLGKQVTQQGSYVGPDRLRFDFTYHKALTSEQLRQVQDIVNDQIQQNVAIETSVVSYDEAIKSGSMALFGEKYGDRVRVLTMGAFSKELCGGTHAKATGDIGLLKISSETSIASGVRRLEAITGKEALRVVNDESQAIQALTQELKVGVSELVFQVKQMAQVIKQQSRLLADHHQQVISQYITETIATHSQSINGCSIVIGAIRSDLVKKNQLQKFLDQLQAKLDDKVALMTYKDKESLSLLIAVGQKKLSQMSAVTILKAMSQHMDAKGGGRAEKARAGIKGITKENIVLTKAKDVITSLLS